MNGRSVALLAGIFAPALLSAQSLLIAGNKPLNTATLVDLSTSKILATLPTGVGPHEAAASRNGRWAVITDYGGGGSPGRSLTLIDLQTRTVARKIDLGDYRAPHGVQFLPGDSLIAVTVEGSNAVLMVDVASGAVRRAFDTMQPVSHMIAVRADGKVGYTSNIRGNSITEIDFASGRTRWLRVADQPEGIGVSPDGAEVWAGSNTEGTIAIVDASSWRVAETISVGERPYRVSFTPDGKKVLASLTASSRVRVYDARTRRELATIDIAGESSATSLAPGGAQPVGIAFSSNSRYAYVACQGIGAVAVIDLSNNKLLRTIPVGPGPDAVAIAER